MKVPWFYFEIGGSFYEGGLMKRKKHNFDVKVTIYKLIFIYLYYFSSSRQNCHKNTSTMTADPPPLLHHPCNQYQWSVVAAFLSTAIPIDMRNIWRIGMEFMVLRRTDDWGGANSTIRTHGRRLRIVLRRPQARQRVRRLQDERSVSFGVQSGRLWIDGRNASRFPDRGSAIRTNT